MQVKQGERQCGYKQEEVHVHSCVVDKTHSPSPSLPVSYSIVSLSIPLSPSLLVSLLVSLYSPLSPLSLSLSIPLSPLSLSLYSPLSPLSLSLSIPLSPLSLSLYSPLPSLPFLAAIHAVQCLQYSWSQSISYSPFKLRILCH